jgi:hypothetical protein
MFFGAIGFILRPILAALFISAFPDGYRPP